MASPYISTITHDDIDFYYVPDIYGQKYRRLIVHSEGHIKTKRGWSLIVWLCTCLCGNKVVVPRQKVMSGHTKSCGCLREDETRNRKTTHGHNTKRRGMTATYRTWRSMHQRCNNPNVVCFFRYGGKGITICERWNSFESFLQDMGIRPEGHTLDRIDCFGNYEPENCRWATASQQARNRSNTLKLSWNDKTLTIFEWEEQTNIPAVALLHRVRYQGWTAERALTTPLKKGSR